VYYPGTLWYGQWDLWLSVGTMLLALMTAWLALETRRMRKGSDKALGELTKHADDAALSSQRSAAAAEESVKATRQAAQTGLRAWVCVIGIPSADGRDLLGKFGIDV